VTDAEAGCPSGAARCLDQSVEPVAEDGEQSEFDRDKDRKHGGAIHTRAESPRRTLNVGFLLALCWCMSVWASVGYLLAK
jgi:hypothetical protein